MKRFFLVILSLILLNTHPTYSANAALKETSQQLTIIFDLGGVVLETKSAMQFIGVPKLLAYAMTQNPITLPQQLKKTLFEFLSQMYERHPQEFDAQDDNGNCCPNACVIG